MQRDVRMTTSTEIALMTELWDFLVGRYKETGHPFEDKEWSLKAALETFIVIPGPPTATEKAEALRVIMTALAEDDGWLMLVLCDHASDPEFKRIQEVCVELRGTFSLRTSDSSPDDVVRGDWQKVDKYSKLYLEVWRYKDLRRRLSSYEYFVRTKIRTRLVALGHEMQTHYTLHAQKQLPSEYQAEWDALDTLDGATRHLPLGSQVMRGVIQGDAQELTWQVQSSYVEYSESNPLSRSWLLANVPVAARALENVAKHAGALLQDNRLDHNTHEKEFHECQSLFLAWETRAKTQLQVSFGVHEERQTGGLKRHKSSRDPPQHARLTQMLHELLHVYQW